MVNLNDLKYDKYYEIYYNNEFIGVVRNKDVLNENLLIDLKYTFIKQLCYEYYNDGNFDINESYGIIIVNLLINNILTKKIFKNSIKYYSESI